MFNKTERLERKIEKLNQEISFLKEVLAKTGILKIGVLGYSYIDVEEFKKRFYLLLEHLKLKFTKEPEKEILVKK